MAHKNYQKIFLLVVCVVLLISSFNQTFAFQTFDLSYHYDINQNLSLQRVIDQKFSEIPISKSFGIKNGTYWFRLNINENSFPDQAIVYVPTHNIDSIELYSVINGKLQYISKTGNTIKMEDLAFNYKFPSFLINHKDLENNYYMKVSFPKGANFPLKIVSKETFNNENTISLIYLSFFYGISLIVLLIHLFYFFKFKNPYYLYYFGFLFTLMFNLLLFDGTLLHVLRPFTKLGKIELLFHVIEEICLLAFSIHFLGLKKRMPNFVKISYSFPILLAIAYLFFSISTNFKIVAIADALGISTMAVLWGIGIYYWKETPYAKFYVLGHLILMPLGVYYFIGYGFGWWPVTGEDTIVKIGSGIDMLVFTYAITYRMKAKADENQKRLLVLEEEIDVVKSQIKNQDPYFIFLKENEFSKTPLTLKEIEVLACVYNGLTNPAIAKKLFISLSTVKTHVSNIFQKFGVKNRVDLKSQVSSAIK